jgi:hypothetical protein
MTPQARIERVDPTGMTQIGDFVFLFLPCPFCGREHVYTSRAVVFPFYAWDGYPEFLPAPCGEGTDEERYLWPAWPPLPEEWFREDAWRVKLAGRTRDGPSGD